jgi:hypothetical protein
MYAPALAETYTAPFDVDGRAALENPGSRACGLGLFDSMDFSTWGFGELLVIALGGYLAIRLMGDVGKVAGTVKKRRRSSAARAARRKRLEEELSGL